MTSTRLNELLTAAGVPTWQAMVGRVGVAVLTAVAPQLLGLLERIAVAGSLALLKRLEDALVPEAAVDVALAIVRGYERDHGETAPVADRWPSAQRAEFAREAIGAWMRAEGGVPDLALINATLEEAVSRLRLEQTAAAKRLTEG